MTDESANDELPADWPKCYACDKPATHSARDTISGPGPDGWMRTVPVGATVYGCDDHPVERTSHRTALVWKSVGRTLP